MLVACFPIRSQPFSSSATPPQEQSVVVQRWECPLWDITSLPVTPVRSGRGGFSARPELFTCSDVAGRLGNLPPSPGSCYAAGFNFGRQSAAATGARYRGCCMTARSRCAALTGGSLPLMLEIASRKHLFAPLNCMFS